jgi:hypothetical protein
MRRNSNKVKSMKSFRFSGQTGQPAPYGIPIDPEQPGHLAAGASLLGQDQIQSLQALVFLGISLSLKEAF